MCFQKWSLEWEGAHGLNTGVWTSPLIALIIHEEFGVSYHPGHVRHSALRLKRIQQTRPFLVRDFHGFPIEKVG